MIVVGSGQFEGNHYAKEDLANGHRLPMWTLCMQEQSSGRDEVFAKVHRIGTVASSNCGIHHVRDFFLQQNARSIRDTWFVSVSLATFLTEEM